MKLAIISPSFAAAGAFPEVYAQALTRLRKLGIEPVEYPTTRKVGASAQERARDVTAAFADPSIAGVLAVIGGNDQVTVIPHLDDEVIRSNPKPFLGYSDNTNLHNHLWQLGVQSFYGGSNHVHLGSGPRIDPEHHASFLAALRDGGQLEITPVETSEDFGVDWTQPAALDSYGHRRPARPWQWRGARRSVTGPTWGGCFEVIDQLAMSGRMPSLEALNDHLILLEAAESLTPPDQIMRRVRALGEWGLFDAASGVIIASPPVSTHDIVPSPEQQDADWQAQCDVVFGQLERYNPELPAVFGVPFGHTRPQWVLPYGGQITLDGAQRRIVADYELNYPRRR
ncbi:Microcin C7 self-immunity protein MccF [Corynebacterium ciconiae DSM 44920]|uniref:S66 family peptidase n=1 Tax=Corynebacterium ciconiae TaxID=227319 RepID=UPI00036A2740|nr:S66 peptidase family protein [Corynebacterium ciconiae]WKD62038.1 Microcin C7 self-immunity protein MccF [Corynebacterium ciconiae DSM 44920]